MAAYSSNEFPATLLKELHFEDVFLTDEQEERLYIVMSASMPYERHAFDRYYEMNVPIDQIAKEEGRDVGQIRNWIETITNNVLDKKEYILTGKY